MKYFYCPDGVNVKGPTDETELLRMFLSHEIPSTTNICECGRKQWVSISEMPSLVPPPPPPPLSPPPPPPNRFQESPPPIQTKAAQQGASVKSQLMLVLIAIILLLPLSASWIPSLPIMTGLILFAIALLYFLQPKKGIWQNLYLKMSKGRSMLGTLKFIVLGAWGLALICFGTRGAINRHENSRAETRLAAEAKKRAEDLVIDNRKVDELISAAKNQLKTGIVEMASSLLSDAISISGASNRQQANDLQKRISMFSSPSNILTVLVSMPDSDFERFCAKGAIPTSLNTGYAVLTEKAVLIGKSLVSIATPIREENHKKAEAEAALKREKELAQQEEARQKQNKAAEEVRLSQNEKKIWNEIFWNMNNSANLDDESLKKFDAELCTKYGITQQQLEEILAKGNKENWKVDMEPEKKARVEKEAGPQPEYSAWDGSVAEVKTYLNEHLRDPKSVEYIQWYPPVLEDTAQGYRWYLKVKYRSKNAFGGYVIETGVAYIRHNAVVGFKVSSRK